MGAYINVVGKTKEGWLSEHAEPVSEEALQTRDFETELKAGRMLVCLVHNGLAFTAAGIAFSESELKRFKHPNSRKRLWFSALIDELLTVSDLEDYLIDPS